MLLMAKSVKTLDEEKNGYVARDQLLYGLYSKVLDSYASLSLKKLYEDPQKMAVCGLI